MSKRRRQRDRAKAKSEVTITATPWDRGPQTPRAVLDSITTDRGEMDEATGKVRNPNNVTGSKRLSVLEAYRNRGRISAVQCAAGTRLHELWAGNSDRDPAAPKTDKMGAGSDPLAGAVDRRSEFRSAWRKVPPAARQALEQVALEDCYLGVLFVADPEAAPVSSVDRMPDSPTYGVVTPAPRAKAPASASIDWRATRRAMKALQIGLDAVAEHFRVEG